MFISHKLNETLREFEDSDSPAMRKIITVLRASSLKE